MKRRMLTICLLLLLGAIVNVAVAWGCATFIDPLKPPLEPAIAYGMRYTANDLRVTGHFWRTTGVASLSMDFDRALRGPFDRSALPEYGQEPTSVGSLIPAMCKPTAPFRDGSFWQECRWAEASGWPALAMWHLRYHFNDWGANKSSQGGIAVFGLTWTEYSGSHMTPTAIPRILPLMPLWPGFAINTVFYAVILWMLFAAPFALRRRLRRKRGLCPACGYDLRGRGSESSKCPECGKAIVGVQT